MKKLVLLFFVSAGMLFADSHRLVSFKVERAREVKNSCIYEGSSAYGVKINGELKEVVRKYKIGTAAGCGALKDADLKNPAIRVQLSCTIIKVIKEVEYDSEKKESYLAASGECK